MPRSKMRARAKQARAVRLFTKGWTYEQIAKKVGFANRGTAYKVVKNNLYTVAYFEILQFVTNKFELKRNQR